MQTRSTSKESHAHSSQPFFSDRSARAQAFFSPIVQAKCDACAAEDRQQRQEEREEEPGGPEPTPVQTKCACHEGDLKLQPKLTLGKPGDRYEQEADSMADAVMRTAAPSAVTGAPRGPLLQRLQVTPVTASLLQRDAAETCNMKDEPKEEGEENEETEDLESEPPQPSQPEKTVSPKYEAGDVSPPANLESRIDASPGGGSMLPSSTREFMESRFATDFSDVRVHTDQEAAERSATFGARAFTQGSHIFFGANEFTAHTHSGRTLIGHELAHVAQNRAATPSASKLEPVASRAEGEAHRAGGMAAVGLPAGPLTARHAGVALTPTSDRVIPLISYSAGDWAVTADEEFRALTALQADLDLSATIVDIDGANMLTALLERIDEPGNRRDLLRLLGERLNSTARARVEPIIQDLDSNKGGTYGAQIQYSLGRAHVSGGAAPFNAAGFNDLISGDSMGAFTGSGATGVNPSQRGYTDLARAGTSMFDAHINPVGSLSAYLTGLTPDQRRRQAELLVRQQISTNYTESYAGQIPSRLQVMRAAGNTHNIEGALVAAIILAEQRDQSRVEDARDFIGALVFSRNTSIGLGQVVPSTARGNDLFADMLTDRTTTYSATTARRNVNQAHMAWLLSSDETNIFAVARYIRVLANAGAAKSIAALPNTQAEFPAIDLAAYANNSSTWPEDNVGALGMYYTSRAWTDDVRSSGWGWFVQEAYRDIKSAALF